MKSILKVVLLITIILVLLHYKKYRYFSTIYEIDQQELEYVNGNELYNQTNPLIITFIEDIPLKDNVNEYSLSSLLSFNKKYTSIVTDEYYNIHRNEICLMRPRGEIRIELVNPKFAKYFKNNKSLNIFNKYYLEKDNFDRVESIDIIVREYNIICIPRHWYFKFHDKGDIVDIFLCDNFASFLGKKTLSG